MVGVGAEEPFGAAVGVGRGVTVERSVDVVLGADSGAVAVGVVEDPELQPTSRHVAVNSNQRQNVSIIDTSHALYSRRGRSQSTAWAASLAWPP